MNIYLFIIISLSLDAYSELYNKLLLISDFNADETETFLKEYMYQHELKNLVKDKSCFKNVYKPSCIDIFLANNNLYFQNNTTVTTGLSDCL